MIRNLFPSSDFLLWRRSWGLYKVFWDFYWVTVGRNLGRAEGIWNFVKQCCGRLRRAGESAENLMAASEGKKQSFCSYKARPQLQTQAVAIKFWQAEIDVVLLCLINLSMVQLCHKAMSLSLSGMGTWTGANPPWWCSELAASSVIVLAWHFWVSKSCRKTRIFEWVLCCTHGVRWVLDQVRWFVSSRAWPWWPQVDSEWHGKTLCLLNCKKEWEALRWI